MDCLRCHKEIKLCEKPFGAYFCCNEHVQCVHCNEVLNAFCSNCEGITNYRTPHVTRDYEAVDGIKIAVRHEADIFKLLEKLKDCKDRLVSEPFYVMRGFLSNGVKESFIDDDVKGSSINDSEQTSDGNLKGATPKTTAPAKNTNFHWVFDDSNESSERSSHTNCDFSEERDEPYCTLSAQHSDLSLATQSELAMCVDILSTYSSHYIIHVLLHCPLAGCERTYFIDGFHNHMELEHCPLHRQDIGIGETKECFLYLGEKSFTTQCLAYLQVNGFKVIRWEESACETLIKFPALLLYAYCTSSLSGEGRNPFKNDTDDSAAVDEDHVVEASPTGENDLFVLWLAGIYPEQVQVNVNVSLQSMINEDLIKNFEGELNGLHYMECDEFDDELAECFGHLKPPRNFTGFDRNQTSAKPENVLMNRTGIVISCDQLAAMTNCGEFPLKIVIQFDEGVDNEITMMNIY